jgi:hypothetical protein
MSSLGNNNISNDDINSDNQQNFNQDSNETKRDLSNKSKTENNSILTDFSKNELKSRENLYRLIISQLFYDGYQHIAVGLSGSVQVFD